MPRRAKLPSQRSTLTAVAAQQLAVINGLLDEVARNYVARLRREIAEIVRQIEQRPETASHARKDLREILRLLAELQINPEKGRRRDLKKIDTLIGRIQSVIERA